MAELLLSPESKRFNSRKVIIHMLLHFLEIKEENIYSTFYKGWVVWSLQDKESYLIIIHLKHLDMVVKVRKIPTPASISRKYSGQHINQTQKVKNILLFLKENFFW